HVPAVRYPRTPGYRPEGAENRYNAWYVKTTVKGTQTGKLAGKTIVLKDNVCLAGVPMMNGASTLEGYVPDVDATIVTRLLDAGATILGKVHCECFCFSGGSHTGAYGAVHNPLKRGYSAGGSSSGSAAVVANREVDMAIGGLQIGVRKEGFEAPNAEPDVRAMVRKGAEQFARLGASVEAVSVPMHPAAMAIWSAIAHEGATAQMMLGNGFGFNWKGL